MQMMGIGVTVVTLIMVMWLDRSSEKWIKSILNWFPAILFAYVIPAIFTHLTHLDLSNIELHEWSRSWIMPMAIVLVMSALSFRQLRIIGLRPIFIFLSGSACIAIFPILLVALLGVFTDTYQVLLFQQDYWKGLVPLVGSWIGGSTSQLVLKEVVACEEGMFLSILVMDNILVNIWTIVMFQSIKKSDYVNKKLGVKDQIEDFVADEVNLTPGHYKPMIITLLICLVSVMISYFMIDHFVVKILVLSVCGLIFGNYISFWDHALVLKVGGIFIILIMAILGLKLNFANFSLPAPIIGFALVWLISHFLIMTLVAYLFKSHMAWVPIASMANVGGISTAPAVTKAYNEEWMPHAILLAILSMVSGTTWGLITVWLFQSIFL